MVKPKFFADANEEKKHTGQQTKFVYGVRDLRYDKGESGLRHTSLKLDKPDQHLAHERDARRLSEVSGILPTWRWSDPNGSLCRVTMGLRIKHSRLRYTYIEGAETGQIACPQTTITSGMSAPWSRTSTVPPTWTQKPVAFPKSVAAARNG